MYESLLDDEIPRNGNYYIYTSVCISSLPLFLRFECLFGILFLGDAFCKAKGPITSWEIEPNDTPIKRREMR